MIIKNIIYKHFRKPSFLRWIEIYKDHIFILYNGIINILLNNGYKEVAQELTFDTLGNLLYQSSSGYITPNENKSIEYDNFV
jgi:hypothetical protein